MIYQRSILLKTGQIQTAQARKNVSYIRFVLKYNIIGNAILFGWSKP